ncbi:carboxymuconolactone decarboxylase family protein, partial [Paenilisteria rocourtiae]|uniref:Alkylhydroperoxidase/carboxymuconolactone decarboxylase family protein YurZ n=1 Tax=Listeria rocourtiae TaxID=647910 RepID=A0A4R6ZII6_9LIST
MSISKKEQVNHNQLFLNGKSRLKEIDPELSALFDHFVFDEVLQYTQLTIKQRMKVTLATLITMQCVNEFKIMLNAAFDIGVTPIEAKEIVYQTVRYVGLRKVFDFSQVTNDVLIKRGI